MRPCKILTVLAALCALMLTGCATTGRSGYDYSAFRESRPRSIVVLPPLNESPDVLATYGVFSQVTFPLAESGYYVLPVALVDETFRQNGLTNPGDIHATSPAKLREIFGADTALYITVTDYGQRYQVVQSASIVTASARLLDLKSGQTLWTGRATASSEEGSRNDSLLAMLLTAVIKQIISSVQDDPSLPIAARTSARLLSAGHSGGILHGPRSPRYEPD
ncbi:MAG: DUF799 domain-containing protein [Zoogloeaceae bacterium]|jgi:hypothetical protein|nr:DUF799 domain-containing protein [Zoogloeaceae bacterium]